MARVITFSRYFQKAHPKAGEPTYFVEAIYKSLYAMKVIPKELEDTYNFDKYINGFAKHHTIRSGNRFKKGDFFSPRVWSGMPYKSKQIIFAADIEIKQVFEFEIIAHNDFFVDYLINGVKVGQAKISILANNDGLTWEDMVNWFGNKDFKGQIICWNAQVNYD